jgi:hypothetical protein
MQWLIRQKNIEPLAIHLSKYRKAISDNKSRENYKVFVDILTDIMAKKQPLPPKTLDLFQFINPHAELRKTYLLALFIRLEKDLIIPNLSIKQWFLFHKMGGLIYYNINLELSVYHYQKAYQLAKDNTDEIKLWLYVDVLFDLYFQLQDWQGPNQKNLVDLKIELYELVYKLEDKKSYHSKISLLVELELDLSMANVAKIFVDKNISFESSLKEESLSKVRLLRAQSIYLQSLGKYKQALTLVKKAAAMQKARRSEYNAGFHYFLVAVAYHYLDAGDTANALPLIEERIIPFSKKYDQKDYLGYYQSQFCYRLALIENSSRLKGLCFDGFNNVEESLGIDNYWTKYTASGVVAWHTLQTPSEDEKYYVNLLESDFEELPSKERVRRGFILERYFISRKSIEKSEKYQTMVAQSIEDYYGSVDAIDRYYHQIMAAELALLKGNKVEAITNLAKIKHKMCGLTDKNPQKIKFLKLQQSLNQALCLNL